MQSNPSLQTQILVQTCLELSVQRCQGTDGHSCGRGVVVTTMVTFSHPSSLTPSEQHRASMVLVQSNSLASSPHAHVFLLYSFSA